MGAAFPVSFFIQSDWFGMSVNQSHTAGTRAANRKVTQKHRQQDGKMAAAKENSDTDLPFHEGRKADKGDRTDFKILFFFVVLGLGQPPPPNIFFLSWAALPHTQKLADLCHVLYHVTSVDPWFGYQLLHWQYGAHQWGECGNGTLPQDGGQPGNETVSRVMLLVGLFDINNSLRVFFYVCVCV